MIHDPKVLILDEPTEGLDPNQRVEIRELIRSIGKERTVLLSTHVLSEVKSTCDRVIIIHQGRIVADGSVEELIDNWHGKRVVNLGVLAIFNWAKDKGWRLFELHQQEANLEDVFRDLTKGD